jgi:hypothetical protein
MAAAAAALTISPLLAQQVPMEGPAQTAVVVAVQSKSGAPLNADDLKLEVDGRAAKIISVTPVQPQTAQVAILIDDGLRATFGTQVQELAKFTNSLPAGTKVLIGYMQSGTVRSSGHFSADHAEVASQLRLPISAAGISASPYFCLSDFVKHWPSQEPGPRFVLMITNGVDPYNGSVSPLNQDSPYVQSAQQDAERAGVAVYSIYYPNSREHGFAVATSGQNYLQQIAEATGGASFYQGNITPVSMAPFLADFAQAIGSSYEIRFEVNVKHGHDLARLKLRTGQSGVKLRAPASVMPGNSAS